MGNNCLRKKSAARSDRFIWWEVKPEVDFDRIKDLYKFIKVLRAIPQSRFDSLAAVVFSGEGPEQIPIKPEEVEDFILLIHTIWDEYNDHQSVIETIRARMSRYDIDEAKWHRENPDPYRTASYIPYYDAREVRDELIRRIQREMRGSVRSPTAFREGWLEHVEYRIGYRSRIQFDVQGGDAGPDNGWKTEGGHGSKLLFYGDKYPIDNARDFEKALRLIVNNLSDSLSAELEAESEAAGNRY